MKTRSRTLPEREHKRRKLEGLPIKDAEKITDTVFSGVWQDRHQVVVKCNVHSTRADLYDFWQDVSSLPVVYRTFQQENGVAVMMEKLYPFVYKAEREKEYHDAIEEIYQVTKFAMMDIRPENIMMREDGQIVFVNLWSDQRASFYYIHRNDNALEAIHESLSRCLFFFRQKEKISEELKNILQEAYSIAPFCFDIYYSIRGEIISVQNHPRQDALCAWIATNTIVKRLKIAKKWFAERGKELSHHVVNPWEDSDDDDPFTAYCKENILNQEADVKEVLKQVGATEEEAARFSKM